MKHFLLQSAERKEEQQGKEKHAGDTEMETEKTAAPGSGQARVLPPGCRRRPNPGKGNCLMEGFAQFQKEKEKDPEKKKECTAPLVRSKLVAWMKRHKDKHRLPEWWDNKSPSKPSEERDLQTFEEYLTLLELNGAWSGHLELLSWSLKQQRASIVISPEHPPLTFGYQEALQNNNNQDKVVRKAALPLYFEAGHYELIEDEDGRVAILPDSTWDQKDCNARAPPST